MKYSRSIIFILVALFSQACATIAQAQVNPGDPGSSCGAPFNSYGPFDYRSAQREQKAIVENAHFTSRVQVLLGGSTGTRPGKDIQYTLAVFPNHPKALQAMEALAEKERVDPPTDGLLTVECWYERALRFRRDDVLVRLLYAKFLLKKNRQDEALHQVDVVADMAAENPAYHFNAGLVYLELNAFDKARQEAWRARELGVERTDIEQKLRALNQWSDPPAPSASAPSAPAN